MTRFWSDGFYRTSINGNTHWVEGHWVDRDDYERLSYAQGSQSPYYEGLNRLRALQRCTSKFVCQNALCPICGADVYFYENEFGSKVFFDELGPPWPKHPCTDSGNKSHTIPLSLVSDGVSFPFEARWQKNNWKLYNIAGAKEIAKKIYQIELSSSELMQKLSVYLLRKSIVDNAGAVYTFPYAHVAFVKHLGDGQYRVSTLTENLNVIEFDVYSSRIKLDESLSAKSVGLYGGKSLKALRRKWQD